MRVLNINGIDAYFPETDAEAQLLAAAVKVNEKLGDVDVARAAVLSSAEIADDKPPAVAMLTFTIPGTRAPLEVAYADILDVRAEKEGSSLMIAGRDERVVVMETVDDVRTQVDHPDISQPMPKVVESVDVAEEAVTDPVVMEKP